MKRKILNIAFMIILLFILIIMHSNISKAAEEILNDVDYWQPSAIDKTQVSSALDKAGVVLGVVRNISIVVAVISLMVIGLKYIFGSVDEKADYKKSLMPYVIGVVMAAAGTTIVTFIFNALN